MHTMNCKNKKKFNNFYIITNEAKDVNLETTHLIQNYLLKRGKTCWVQPEQQGEEISLRRQTMESEIPPEVECVIVLGGDGTLLRAARNLVNRNLPFLGINLGHLGYLTEGDRNGLSGILERVIAEEYFLEERMMLRGRVKKRDGTVVSDDVALNDITINRNRSLRVIQFKLYVNGAFLYLYTADGIIISTPTGSTAYNLSCGGPVVEPTAKLFVVTPIAPHSLNNRSLILSSTDTIELELLGSEKDLDSQVEYVTYYDGDTVVQMEPGDRLEIIQAPQVTNILKLSTMSFLETLRIKMS